MPPRSAAYVTPRIGVRFEPVLEVSMTITTYPIRGTMNGHLVAESTEPMRKNDL